MKAIANLLATSVALLTTLLAAEASAGPQAAVHPWLIGQVAVQQFASRADAGQQEEQLLRQARDEMRAGQFAAAERLIARAEQLGVKHDGLLARYQDSPQKARIDLARLRGNVAPGVALPSSRFQPQGADGADDPNERASQPLRGSSVFSNGESVNTPTDPNAPVRGEQALDLIGNNSLSALRNYLTKGRQSLAAGDTTAAVSWYQRAKGLGVDAPRSEYGLNNLVDDLRRAGVDVAQLNGPAATPAIASPFASRPDQMPTTVADRIPTSNDRFTTDSNSPFAQRVQANPYAIDNSAENFPVPNAPPADAAGETRNPYVNNPPLPDSGSRFTTNTVGRPAIIPQATSNNGPADASNGNALFAARQALAQGNVSLAQRLVEQAAQSGAVFPLSGDSPQKVDMLIRQHRAVTASGAGQENSPQHARQHADLLLDQAEGLLRYGDLTGAERLGQQAAETGARYAQFERSPQRLLAQINAERGRGATGVRSGTGNQFSQTPPGNLPSGGDSPVLNRLPAAAGDDDLLERKDKALALLTSARTAVARGQLDSAQQWATQAAELNVPSTEFDPQDPRPQAVLAEIARARADQQARANLGSPATPLAPVQQAGAVQPAGGRIADGDSSRFPVSLGAYVPEQDTTRNVAANTLQPADPNAGSVVVEQIPQGAPMVGAGLEEDPYQLLQQGEAKLQKFQREEALADFQKAWKHEDKLDPDSRRKLITYLGSLRNNANQPRRLDNSALDAVDAKQQILMKQLYSDVSHELTVVNKIREKQPDEAKNRLERVRQRVAQSELESAARQQLLTRVDRSMNDLDKYITENQFQIEEDRNNRQIRADVDRDRQVKVEVQEKLVELVEEFNRLVEEDNFPAAEAIARQARELDPNNPVVQNITWKSRFIRRQQSQMAIREQKEDMFVRAMDQVDLASIPLDDGNPLHMPDLKYWEQLTERRKRLMDSQQRQYTEAEREIQRALEKPVDVKFMNRPLSEVMQTLSLAAGINVYLDPQGLAAEGITSDTPVLINLTTKQISLKSALNHILQPLRLSYVIQDEVLKVTSEQVRDTNVRTQVYNVADLVIPIPNFVPSYNMGLPGAINQAYNSLGYGAMGGRANSAPMAVFAENQAQPQSVNPLALAQPGGLGLPQGGGGMMGGPGGLGTRGMQNTGFGPGGVGGGPQADFDSLIDLVTSTVSPTSWDEVGGPGSIRGFETNLSLVVSQTQEIHEQIADLLDQLRRLQDLQVTIEVRFITLSDNFFERVGVNFNFDIDSNVSPTDAIAAFNDTGPSVTIGLDPTGIPTADLDLQFSQDGFAQAVPAFGGFDPTVMGATFGFAILSDIEAFFVVAAAQADVRSNIMQAPKVTLFNGQQAFISDTRQVPFVTSVIPVVGDFAAAHQPVIVVLSEGTSLSVQAVVSPDRRFIRLTVVPFFSRIGDVQEFTFNGRTTSNTGTAAADPTNPNQTVSNDAETVTEGTTVQLPEFSFVTVTTTVSVPDGGTVLLGGIKRLSEGRNEQGVPVLSKLPYINRLFRNIGIGRDTQTLMLMVTPRIIIQEEEEENLLSGP